MAAKLTETDLQVEALTSALEGMAVNLTMTDLPAEVHSTSMEQMTTKLTVTDLPLELLLKIFSFLYFKELPKLFIVCHRFNVAAKHPSLWRRCEFKFRENDSRKISSFCRFFSQYPFFRELSIIEPNFPFLEPFDCTSMNSFNQLFETLKHLICLEFNIYSENIVLPPSLRHFTCKLSENFCKEDKFSFLDQCPKIERLNLDATDIDARLTNGVTSVLLKYQRTLSALYLKIGYFEEEWIPLMANCVSLKELGLETWCRHENLSKLFGTSLSSRLEILDVTNIDILQSFDEFGFPELKILNIDSSNDLMNILPLIKRMPKLRSLRFFGPVSIRNVEDFCSVVRSCKTLRSFLIETYELNLPAEEEFYLNAEREFEIINRKLNEGSSEENKWELSHEYIEKFLTPTHKCNCWNSSKISFVQNQQQKQLRFMEVNHYNDDDSVPFSCESDYFDGDDDKESSYDSEY